MILVKFLFVKMEEVSHSFSLFFYPFFSHFSFLFFSLVGKVYFATRKCDKKLFAMKFFGYSKFHLPLAAINNEIELMKDLRDISYLSRFEGSFMDSNIGYVPNRVTNHPYPVIVMEALEGGDLFDRMYGHKTIVSERYLASSFKCIILALHQIHQEGYLHRDIKLENLMYESEDIHSPLKVSFLFSLLFFEFFLKFLSFPLSPNLTHSLLLSHS